MARSSVPAFGTEGIRFAEVLPDKPTDGTTYLLIHGLGGSLEHWAEIIGSLGRDGRTIAIDVPGFGRSRTVRGNFSVDGAVEEIRSFCDSNNIEDCILVSHSIACVIAARLAAVAPQRFKRIILVSGTLGKTAEIAQKPLRVLRNPRLGIVVMAQFLASTLPVPLALLRLGARSRLLRILFLWPFVAHPTRLDPAAMVRTLARSGSFASLRILFTAHSIDYFGIISSIKLPTDLVNGERDRLIDDGDVERVHSMVTVARESEIKDCGHWLWLESPAELVEFVTSWRADAPTEHPHL